MYVTYPTDVRQASKELGGLDERREPLSLVPVADPVPADLTKTHYHRLYARLFGSVLQNVFGDPLRLRVATAERGRRVVERDFWGRDDALIVCEK